MHRLEGDSMSWHSRRSCTTAAYVMSTMCCSSENVTCSYTESNTTTSSCHNSLSVHGGFDQ